MGALDHSKRALRLANCLNKEKNAPGMHIHATDPSNLIGLLSPKEGTAQLSTVNAIRSVVTERMIE
jgi:hypothetical protein